MENIYNLITRRDGKTITQLALVNRVTNVIERCENTLAELKLASGNALVSYAGNTPAPLFDFTDDDLA